MIRYRYWVGAFALAFAVLCQASPAHAVADTKLTPAPSDLNKYLPNDTGYMFRVNFQQLQKSALLKPFVADIKEKMKAGPAQKHLQALGFDPFKDLGTLTLAGPLTKNPEKHLLILTGKFDTDKFQKAVKEAAKKEGDEVVKVTKNGDYTVWEVSPKDSRPPAPATYFVVMVDSNTILATAGKSLLKESLEKASGKKKAELSKEMAPLIAKTKGDQGVSLVVLASALAKADFIPPAFAGKAKEELKNFKFLRFAVIAKEDAKIQFSLGTKDADTAKEIADKVDQVKFMAPLMLGMMAGDPQKAKQMKPAIDAAKEVLATLDSSTKDATVKIEFTITKKLVEKLKAEAMKANKKGEEKKDDE
jgi:hypothetical protein